MILTYQDEVLSLDKTGKRIMHLANSDNAEDVERLVLDVIDFFSKVDESKTEEDSLAPALPCVRTVPPNIRPIIPFSILFTCLQE